MGFSRGASLIVQMVKSLSATWETWVHSLGLEDPLGKDGNPLQYSCLENAMGAWQHTVHGLFLEVGNLKTLIKKIANDQTNGKKYCAHGLGELIMLTGPYRQGIL